MKGQEIQSPRVTDRTRAVATVESRAAVRGRPTIGEAVNERRTSPAMRTLRRARRAVADAERAIAALAKLVRRAEATARSSGAEGGARRLKLSPKRRATLKLQGSYMGYMRQLKPGQKKRVKQVKENKGFEAAIAVARRLAKG